MRISPQPGIVRRTPREPVRPCGPTTLSLRYGPALAVAIEAERNGVIGRIVVLMNDVVNLDTGATRAATRQQWRSHHMSSLERNFDEKGIGFGASSRLSHSRGSLVITSRTNLYSPIGLIDVDGAGSAFHAIARQARTFIVEFTRVPPETRPSGEAWDLRASSNRHRPTRPHRGSGGPCLSCPRSPPVGTRRVQTSVSPPGRSRLPCAAVFR
jgi:hypothetical protein